MAISDLHRRLVGQVQKDPAYENARGQADALPSSSGWQSSSSRRDGDQRPAPAPGPPGPEGPGLARARYGGSLPSSSGWRSSSSRRDGDQRPAPGAWLSRVQKAGLRRRAVRRILAVLVGMAIIIVASGWRSTTCTRRWSAGPEGPPTSRAREGGSPPDPPTPLLPLDVQSPNARGLSEIGRSAIPHRLAGSQTP